MSFKDLKKDELLAVADYFGVEVKKTDNKDTIVAALGEDGVSFEEGYADYKAATEVEQDEEEKDDNVVITSKDVVDVDEVDEAPAAPATEQASSKGAKRQAAALVPDGYELVKKTRNNPVYEVRTYRFTDQHPYVLVKEEDVDFLIEVEGGFALAKASEVMDFYA